MKLGNAPCSWGVFYPTGNTITAEGYLDAVARAGYRFTELGPLGFMGQDPAWIADALKCRGLEPAGACHVHTLADPASKPALIADLHRWGRLLSALGAPTLVLMDESEWYPPAHPGRVDRTGWQTAISMIRDAHQMMADQYGIALYIHPHVGTCIEREDQINRLLDETDVAVCFDTGHHAFWDQDVLSYMDQIWNRIRMVHLKNVDPQVRARVLQGDLGVNASFAAGVMSPLMQGAVDIPAVVRKMVSKGYDGFCIVEQDLAEGAGSSPEDLATRNLTFLHSVMAD